KSETTPYTRRSSTRARTRSSRGYEGKPAKPIAAHAPTPSSNAAAMNIASARSRRVTSSQTAKGQRKSFETAASAAAKPATELRSRYRHAAAVASSNKGVIAPSSRELTEAVETIARP